MRRVIPACVVSRIREEFPSEDGEYTGYLEGAAVSEMDFSWVGEVENT